MYYRVRKILSEFGHGKWKHYFVGFAPRRICSYPLDTDQEILLSLHKICVGANIRTSSKKLFIYHFFFRFLTLNIFLEYLNKNEQTVKTQT